MTSGRIGLLVALLGIGLCGACGSSSSTNVAVDADATTAGLPDSGTTIVGDAAATGGTVALSGGTTGTASGGAVATGGTSGRRATESSTGKPIAPGTVNMDAMGDGNTASCQQFIRLTNPAQPLTGYQPMDASVYLNDSRARRAGYLYLDGGKDAVILPGPAVTYPTASVDVTGQLTTCTNYESACLTEQGYVVKVNGRLSYLIIVEDWEDEIALGQVDLCLNNSTLTSQFVFAATVIMGGMTHVTITPILDGVSGTPTAVVDIESDTGR
jgi:hypothetical protein